MTNQLKSLCEKFTLGETRRAVIFLPGLSGTALELGSIPKMIERLGHTVCIPRIHGFYAQTDIQPYEEWLSQLNVVVDLLLETHDSVALVGLSMGATLALAYEAQHKKCEAVVALSPVLAYDGWNVAWYQPLLRLVFMLGIKNWYYKESEPYGLRNLEIRNRVAKQVKEQETTEVGSASLSAKHLYQGLRLINFAKDIVDEFNSDLLIIISVDDDVVAPASVEWLYKTVKSNVRELVWLGNSYHIITLDNEREVVVNESVEFLQLAFDRRRNIDTYSEEVKQLIIRDRIAD